MARTWIIAANDTAAQGLAQEAGLAGPDSACLAWDALPQHWPQAPQVELVLLEWPRTAGPAARVLATFLHLSDADVFAVVADGAQSQAAVDAGAAVVLRRPLSPPALQRAAGRLLVAPTPADPVPPRRIVVAQEERFERLARLYRDLFAATTVETFADLLAQGASDLLDAVAAVRVFPGHRAGGVIRGWGDWDGVDLRRLARPLADRSTAGEVAVGRTTVVVPLLHGQRPFGALLLRRLERPFNRDEIACAELAAAHAAVWLADLATADGRTDDTVETLLRALERRDGYTSEHSRRAAAYTELLLEAFGTEPDTPEFSDTMRGALLHDVGKIGVPDDALLAPGPLNDTQWEAIRRHALMSYQLLEHVDGLAGAAEVAYAHHERYGGGGYPRGLAGDQIPLGARIFAVADAFDAMTTRRVYRPARSLDDARAEIVRCAGTQFDPAIVELFCRVYPAFARRFAA